jgi:signal transduction histidine kinase
MNNIGQTAGVGWHRALLQKLRAAASLAPGLIVVSNALIGIVLAVACAAILLAKMKPPLEAELTKRSVALCGSFAVDLQYAATVADAKLAALELAKLESEPSARVEAAWLLANGAELARYLRKTTTPQPRLDDVETALAGGAPRVRRLASGTASLLEVACPVAKVGAEGARTTLNVTSGSARGGRQRAAGALLLLIATDEIAATVGRSFTGALLPLSAAIFAAVALLLSIALFVIGRLRSSMQQLHEMQRQLVEASREAGMADVATTVLHNVGNVLNSVNVSAGIVSDTIRRSKVSRLGKANELIREHEADLAAFLIQDAKGKHLPAYLATLGEALAGEQRTILAEIASLQKSVEHIRVIISMQQSHARSFGGVLEELSLPDLLEDALKVNELAYDKHQVQVVRDFDGVRTVVADRHKIFQVMMNLLSNARHAVREVRGKERRITVRLRAVKEARYAIIVEDTGCGIPAENLSRIFQYGFTTKKNGHGFGLHSSACAARELGGTLSCRSDGEGKGATFILELPNRAREVAR